MSFLSASSQHKVSDQLFFIIATTRESEKLPTKKAEFDEHMV
jgi:hypothetical protein